MTDASPPFLAPLPPPILAGRERLLEDLKSRLLSPNPPQAIVLGYLPGVGKTALAAELANEREVLDHFPGGVLWAALGRNPDPAALMGEWLVALSFRLPQIAALKNAGDRAEAIRERPGQAPMLLVLDDAWEAGDARPMLLGGPGSVHLVTTRRREVVHELEGAVELEVKELEHQAALEVLERLAPEAVRADREQATALALAAGGLPLGLVLMGKYLSSKTRGGIPRRIHQALAELQSAERRLGLETSVSPYFRPASEPEGLPLSLMATIQVSDQALDETARDALRGLAASSDGPPTFSVEFAEALEVGGGEDIENLFAAGLLEEVRVRDWQRQVGSGPVEVEQIWQTEDASPEADERPERLFRMPRAILDYAQNQAGGLLDQAEELHRRAAVFYKNWLRNFEETQADAQPYLRQFRYVDPIWLAAMTSFLTHLGYTDPTYANLQLARLYFDAFWWWGCYVPFPFCEQLVEQWQARRASPQDLQWLGLVKQFHQAYPTGYEKAGKGDWAAVEQALIELRALGELGETEGDPSQLDAERLHVRGITDIFLAEARRYRDAHDPLALNYYAEAQAIFKTGAQTSDDDAWNLPWVLWHQADLHLERGENDLALEKAARARRRAAWGDEQAGRSDGRIIQGVEQVCALDNEIIANCYRVEADARWQQGDVPRAFSAYARAVLHAYIFLGCPVPPNFYTVAFYQEMTTRTLQRLEKLLAAGRPEEAARAAAQLHAFWQPFWQATGGVLETEDPAALLGASQMDRLAQLLFPPLPTEEEMRQGEHSEHIDRVKVAIEVMREQLF